MAKRAARRAVVAEEPPLLGTVAIVGFPNVGKSTLVNRLTATRAAVVHETPGVTRDRKELVCEWNGKRFLLVDTGGVDIADASPITRRIGEQARTAIAEADLVLFVTDARAGITPGDEELAAILRAAGVTVLLVTHDREEAFSLADRIALMCDGSIVQAGVPEDVYYAPATRWAAEFVGAGNFVPGRIAGDLVETLLGSFPVANRNGATAVDVLIRPELLTLRPDPDGPAEVVAREFRGHDVFYRVRLDDGTTVCSQRPSTEEVPLGARVSLRTHEGSVALFQA